MILCALGCKNAVGLAIMEGKPGTPAEGAKNSYPLCAYHLKEVQDGKWTNAILKDIEEW